MAPLIGSFFKMAVPFIVILPGLLGLALRDPAMANGIPHLVGENVAAANPGAGLHTYNEILPLMMARYLGPGLLGLGITALIAGFMSGMAGNVSAFSTVWTYDIYRPLIHKKATDSHYVLVGRLSIFIGVLVSIGAAYLVMHAQGIMDYVQALFSIFVAPLLATILLGMFWKRATRWAGFLGLLLGIVFSASLFMWVKLNPAKLAVVALSPYAKPMAENVFRALWAFLFAAIIIIVVSMFGKPRPVAELDGLVYGATKLPSEEWVPYYKREWFWASLVMVIFVILNVAVW